MKRAARSPSIVSIAPSMVAAAVAVEVIAGAGLLDAQKAPEYGGMFTAIMDVPRGNVRWDDGHEPTLVIDQWRPSAYTNGSNTRLGRFTADAIIKAPFTGLFTMASAIAAEDEAT